MPRPIRSLSVLGLLAVSLAASAASAASLIYRGELETDGRPASGRHDLRLTAYRSADGDQPAAAPIDYPAVELLDGRFELRLEIPGAVDAAWVELAVRAPGSADFVPLQGRSKASLAPTMIGQCWSSTGDSGVNPAVNFLGTTDTQPLVLRGVGGTFFNTTTAVSPSVDDIVFRARPGPADADVDLRLVTRNNRNANLYVSDLDGSLGITVSNLTAGTARISVSGGNGGLATLSNGGAWTNASSRSFKEGFVPVNPAEVLQRLLELPITTWTYGGSAEGLHLGPVAEDFKAAFGLAGDGRSIATVDADGVAMAAIQGLNAKLEADNATLRERNAALEARVGALAERLEAIEARLEPSPR